MTEEEAKTKLCPMTMNHPPVYGADGCGIQQGGPYLCGGSACMAWRVQRHVVDGEGYSRRAVGHGFCGLAGQPS